MHTIIKTVVILGMVFLWKSIALSGELPECTSSDYLHNCVGKFVLDDGDIYTGEFQNNTAHGYGTYLFSAGDKFAGDVYEGDWVNGEKHGTGVYTHADGTTYIGEWQYSQPHGYGEERRADGEHFIGEWINGEWRKGTYTRRPDTDTDDIMYSGEFMNGEYHGIGTIYFKSGNEYSGSFKNGQINGEGTWKLSDGGGSSGQYKNGYLNGYGRVWNSSGSIVKEGFFIDGVLQHPSKNAPSPPALETPSGSNELISASSGSGFAVSSEGYFITNHHVIDGCQKILLHVNGTQQFANVVTSDPQNDLALLQSNFQPSVVFALSDSQPELLQDIYVAGYPFGDKVSNTVKVTKGIISSLTGLGNNFSNIQIDAALQSGNSGGPILNIEGNVIGVAVAKLDAKYMFEEFGIIPENTNFGIKASVVRNILNSNGIKLSNANKSEINKSKLAEMITKGTYYISCWMSLAQIEKMKTKKVFFNSLR